MRVPSIVLIAAVLAQPAAAQSGAAFPIRAPDPAGREPFSRSASQADIASVYPTAALRRGLSGQVLLRCRAAANGLMTGCRVAEENPVGAGFGAAALALTAQYQARPGTVRVGEEVSIPIRFATSGASLARSDAVLVIGPRWLETPTRAQVRATSPPTSGVATLRCRVRPDGRLRHCDVVRENPRFAGLRRAALGLSGAFRMAPPLDGPLPTAAFVDIPLAVSRNPGDRLVQPPFVSRPGPEEIGPALSPFAGAGGRVRVVADCRIGEDAALTDCRFLSGPADAQAAAAPLLARFVAARWTDDGQATVGARTTVALNYVAE